MNAKSLFYKGLRVSLLANQFNLCNCNTATLLEHLMLQCPHGRLREMRRLSVLLNDSYSFGHFLCNLNSDNLDDLKSVYFYVITVIRQYNNLENEVLSQ